MEIKIGEEYCLLTKNAYLVDKHTADYAEVVDIIPGITDVPLPETVDHIQNAAYVRFPNGDTAFVRQTDLVDPESLPFKIGDNVKNTVSFNGPLGITGWPGIRWVVRQVTYSFKDDGQDDLKHAVMRCDSPEYGLRNYTFFSHELKKY